MKKLIFKIKAISLFVIALLVLGACSSDKTDWQNAKQLGSIPVYEDFIKNNPESVFVDSAKHKIEVLNFQKVINENSDSSYNKFINLYPQSEFRDSVNVLLEKLDFDNTLQSNTISEYISFIKKYPESRFLDDLQIKSETQTISFMNDFKKNHFVVYSRSSKNNNYLKASLKITSGTNVGNATIVGQDGISAEKEFRETTVEEIFAEHVEYVPFISVYIGKNTVLLSGKNGTKFKRLPNNKILISEGTLYKLTINK